MPRIRLFPEGAPNTSKVPTAVLHHMCANRARECWSLWNQGYPIAPIRFHVPSSNEHVSMGGLGDSDSPDDYSIAAIFDDACVLTTKEPKRADQLHGRASISATELAIFLIDLLRLEKKGINGRFSISVLQRRVSFDENRKYIANRLVLVPDLSDISENGSVESTEILSLARLAARLHKPSKWNSWSRVGSIESILSRIDEIEFRVDKKTEGSGKLFVDIEDEEHKVWLESEGVCNRLWAGVHGSIHPGALAKSHRGIEIPVKISPYFDREPWVDSILGWTGKDIAWLGGERSKIVRDFAGTLSAEIRHAQNSGFSYRLIDYDKKRRTAKLRLESRGGSRNAEDLWEEAVRDRDMTIAVNGSADVFDWDEDDLWDMKGTSEKDPFLLSIRGRSGKPPSEKGFVKIASVPRRALMKRKVALMRKGTKTAILRKLTIPDSPGHEMGWRLDCQGFVQALQGPPGTGKTWTATQIVKDLIERNPCSRILVCSKEHLALDHLSERLAYDLRETSHEVVRINRGSDREGVNHDSEISPEAFAVRLVDEVENLPENSERGHLKEKMHEQGNLATWVERLSILSASVICTTTLDRSIEELQSMGECFDFAIIEEAGKSYPSEIIGPLSISMSTLLIGDHLQLPPFEIREIKESLSDSIAEGYRNYSDGENRESLERSVVELSVPHWELSDFSHDDAVKEVSDWLQPFEKIWNVSNGIFSDSLGLQWRMFEELSDTIGGIFYGRPFDSMKIDSFAHDELPGVFGRESSRMIVVDTPHCSKGGTKESSSSNSYTNSEEAKQTSGMLAELLDEGCDAVAIAPYKGQVAEIQKLLPKRYRDRVRTVDGFQGKEADFILLSLVRNNTRTGSSRRWGFFRDPRRINVALSRAREGLVVITSVQQIVETDWKDDEGHLSSFIEAVLKRGKVVDCRDIW